MPRPFHPDKSGSDDIQWQVERVLRRCSHDSRRAQLLLPLLWLQGDHIEQGQLGNRSVRCGSDRGGSSSPSQQLRLCIEETFCIGVLYRNDYRLVSLYKWAHSIALQLRSPGMKQFVVKNLIIDFLRYYL